MLPTRLIAQRPGWGIWFSHLSKTAGIDLDDPISHGEACGATCHQKDGTSDQCGLAGLHKRRLAAQRAAGRSCSRGRVERLMRRHHIRARLPHVPPKDDDSRNYLLIAPNGLHHPW